jgi:hypothetical protein
MSMFFDNAFFKSFFTRMDELKIQDGELVLFA